MRDDHLDEKLSMDERVDIAVDQTMSEIYTGLDGRQSFNGIGTGVILGHDFRGTAAEFCALMRKRREEQHELRDRKRSTRSSP